MGLAVSRFSTLHKLLSNDNEQLHKFAQFKLIAIVLHSNQDGAFADTMSQRFEYLYEKTGKHFLFISLIQPPQSWRATHQPFDKDFSLESYNLTDEENEAMLTSFLKRIHVHYDDLPGMILVDNMQASKGRFIASCAEDIENQLCALGDYCSTHEQVDIMSKEMISLFDEISTEGLWSTIKIDDTISQSLLEVSAVPKMNSDAFLNKNYAQRLMEKILRNANTFTSTLSQIIANRHLTHQLMPDIDLRAAQRENIAVPTDQLSEAEKETIEYLSLYNMLASVCIEQPNSTFSILSGFAPSKLFSMTNLQLIQALESESNASIVQRIRQSYQINMLDYYCKYDPNKRNKCILTLDKNAHEINFNRQNTHNSGDLYTITIGDIRPAFILFQNRHWFDDCPELTSDFAQFLYEMNNFRSSHAGKDQQVSHMDLVKCYFIFQNNFTNIYYPILMRLKDNVKANMLPQ